MTSILLAALTVAGSLQEPPPSRSGLILFRMPPDRQRQEEPGYTLLRLKDPAAPGYQIVIRPGAPASATVGDAVQNHAVVFLARSFRVQPVTEWAFHTHPAGYDMAVRGYALDGADNRRVITYIFGLQAGNKCAIVEFVAADARAYGDGLAMSAFIAACRLAHLELVVPGDPPLTHYEADETVDCIQWLLDAPFTAEQKELFRAEIVDGWRKKDAETIEGVATIRKFREEMAKLTPDQQDLVRKKSEPEMIESLRKETDRCSKLLVEIYDASRKPIAEGPPPLTRQQADAELEGVRARPAAADRDAWAKGLAERWPSMPAEARKGFEPMPAAWAAARAAWAEIAPAERDAIKGQFAQVDFVKQLRTEFAKLRKENPAADAEALKAKMNQNYLTTSGLLKSGYDSTMTMMAAFRNMNSSSTGYRYTYRPR
jgi:hypothetical protein